MIINYAGNLLNSEEIDVDASIQNMMETIDTLKQTCICVFSVISSTECTITFCRHYDDDPMPEPGYMNLRDAYILLGVSIDDYWPQFFCPELEEENYKQFIPIELFSYIYKKATEEVGADVPRIVWPSTKKNMVILRLVY